MSENFKLDKMTSILGETLEKSPSIKSGDSVIAETSPGCWGPMITPSLYGGHEITGPLWVEDAKPGDALVITVEKIDVLSQAATSGTGRVIEGRFDKDPSVKAICPVCHIDNPETYLEGIGEDAIRCKKCGNPVLSQTFENGYTVLYDEESNLAVAVDEKIAKEVAEKTLKGGIFLPKNSKQHLATILGRSDFSDLLIRGWPMIGNIGCMPSKRCPASKNAGDYFHTISKTGLFEELTKDEINDAHMDIAHVGEGCIVISPVLVEGAGFYLGDIHLTQGQGEISGHTLDVSARVQIKIEILKDVNLKGPILIPKKEELDPRFLPFTEQEYEKAQSILQGHGSSLRERNYPVQFVGSGPNMNEGLDNAFERAVAVTGLALGEIKNRATVGGGIGIGRTSGMVYITVMLNEDTIEKIGLIDLVKKQYL